jgi:1-hydroxycarotenoid 3,4-desaturase
VVLNGDAAALSGGRFGAAAAGAVPAVPRAKRSLSAVTWAAHVETRGFPLVRHNVFFSADYAREFAEIFDRAGLPTEPTVYVCAQDRGDDDRDLAGPERLLILSNAPARGDWRPFTEEQVAALEDATFAVMRRCGLEVARDPARMVRTTPMGFDALFPATGGALYGQAVHGWQATFNRPGSATRLPGLFLAGGSAHPGAGVPMATLSGRLAAAAVLQGMGG